MYNILTMNSMSRAYLVKGPKEINESDLPNF
jgi:hypothetical protein